MAARMGVRDTQIEKDYVISWICYGIAKNRFLRENLVFKGGTVLKKDNSILCYNLEEVIAEKMRSIMQRTAPRDLYDLWYLLVEAGLDIEDAIYCFHDKAKHKGYEPKDLVAVLEKKKQIFYKHWSEHLSDQLIEIPDFEEVWRELGKHWRKFQKFIQ